MLNFILRIFQFIDGAIVYLFSNNFDLKKFLIKNFSPISKKIIFFDVGSNLGKDISFIKSLYIKNNIHAFEPNFKSFTFLKKNFDNIILNNLAVDNISDKKIIFYETLISSNSSLKKNFIDNRDYFSRITKKYPIKTISIDNYCKKNKINHIDFLKIDTQGNEYEVLESAKKYLKKRKIKLIKIEITFLNKKKRYNSINLFKILNFISKFKYNLVGISDQKFINNKLFFFNAYFFYK
jgi:FkbM family methyltransferase